MVNQFYISSYFSFEYITTNSYKTYLYSVTAYFKSSIGSVCFIENKLAFKIKTDSAGADSNRPVPVILIELGPYR